MWQMEAKMKQTTHRRKVEGKETYRKVGENLPSVTSEKRARRRCCLHPLNKDRMETIKRVL